MPEQDPGLMIKQKTLNSIYQREKHLQTVLEWRFGNKHGSKR